MFSAVGCVHYGTVIAVVVVVGVDVNLGVGVAVGKVDGVAVSAGVGVDVGNVGAMVNIITPHILR